MFENILGWGKCQNFVFLNQLLTLYMINPAYNHYLVIEFQTIFVSLRSFASTLKDLISYCSMLNRQKGFVSSAPLQS